MTSENNKKMDLEVTPEHREKEEQQKDLLKFAGTSITCCVSIIDIVDSTKTTSKIPESRLGNFYSIFLNYVSGIIGDHGGIVVKNIGDSLLYYFSDNSGTGNSITDTFYCNLDILAKRDVLNEKLRQSQLPSIGYRISSDYGKVFVAESSISSVSDIFGPTVNMCAKINHVGKPNTFFIGSDLYLHAKNIRDFNFDEVSENEVKIIKHRYPAYFVQKK